MLQPKYWFSAHLHVRFAALFKHSGQTTRVIRKGSAPESSSGKGPDQPNSEEITIGDDNGANQGVDGTAVVDTNPRNEEEMNIDSEDEEVTAVNGEEIAIEDEDDGVEDARPRAEETDEDPMHGPNGDAGPASLETGLVEGRTRFLALSKCLEGQDFLQVGEEQDLLRFRATQAPSSVRSWRLRHHSTRTRATKLVFEKRRHSRKVRRSNQLCASIPAGWP